MRSVVYSIAAPLNQGGMTTIAWHAGKALQEAECLRLILSPSSKNAESLAPRALDLPWPFRKGMAALNRLGCHLLNDDFFDRWASAWIENGDDFYGWLNQSLACIRKTHSLGGKTFVDRGSVEPRLQERWLLKEYKKFGLNINPMNPRSITRMITEADETDFIIAPSRIVAESYHAAEYECKKLKINPLGIDLTRFCPVNFPPERKGTRIAFIGQISIQKGIPQLLEAWKSLAPKNTTLVLAGIVPPIEKAVIEPLLQEARNVEWNGHCNDIPKLLETCDALVLPSVQDGFGLVVLEAMAMVLPVLISDRVGAQDCVHHGANGWVYCFDSDDSLKAHLEIIIKHPDHLKVMRQPALQTAQQYSWKAYGDRLVKIISQSQPP